jgi:pentose-5-phosphate-3-epimerase
MLGDDAIDITVDGGVDTSNAHALTAAGAKTLVAGTSVFGASDRNLAIAALRRCVLED